MGFAPPRFESGGNEHNIPDEVPELANSKYKVVQHGLAYTLEFRDAVVIAEERNQPIFIDFTGVNCANCRTMETSVLNKPDVLNILSELPRAQLFLDQMPTVADKAEQDRLLDFNQKLSSAITGGMAMPSYVLLSPDGKSVLAQVSGVQSHERFHEFLTDALQRFDAAETARAEQSAATAPTAGVAIR